MTHSTTTELRKSIQYDRITKDYAMRYEGELIGYAPTYGQAETILNQYVYELLTHGGCETATALDGGQTEEVERVVARHYGPGVIIGVALDNHDDILVKLDTATAYGSQTVWQARSEVETPPPPGMPGDDGSEDGGGPPNNRAQPFCATCGDEGDCPDCDPKNTAPRSSRPRCHCGALATIWDDVRHLCGPHYLAPVRTPDPALGRDLMRLRRLKYASFVAMLMNAEPERLRHYAESYAAFVRTHNPASTLDASLVLARWAREIDHDGPAAPAMRVAA